MVEVLIVVAEFRVTPLRREYGSLRKPVQAARDEASHERKITDAKWAHLIRGTTLTDFNHHVLPDSKAGAQRNAVTTDGTGGLPEDIAEAAVHFTNDGAAYTTGVTIFVDGGLMPP